MVSKRTKQTRDKQQEPQSESDSFEMSDLDQATPAPAMNPTGTSSKRGSKAEQKQEAKIEDSVKKAPVRDTNRKLLVVLD